MPSFQGTVKTSYEMMTIRMNSSSSSEKSVLPWTHETRSSYPLYWTVSLALEMVRIQTDFKHAHTKRLTPRCLYMSKTKSVMIRTVDTDIVVLTVAYFQGLPNLEQLWIAFATGKNFRYILIHEIASDYVLRWPQDCCSFGHSSAATKHHTSPTVERNPHGRPGLHGQRSQPVLSPCHCHKQY